MPLLCGLNVCQLYLATRKIHMLEGLHVFWIFFSLGYSQYVHQCGGFLEEFWDLQWAKVARFCQRVPIINIRNCKR